ncbi:MAG: hypothetical protein IT158_06940 [Bryobacterales bacterium]|nr:hypothetical protein [Bryobacterales bacterium]
MLISPKAQALLIPFGVMMAGALFSTAVVYFWRCGREYRVNGVTTQALVTRKFRKGGGLENYYALFSFADMNHRPHEVEVKVASRAWHSLREGESTAVTYLAGDPERVAQGPRWAKKLVAGFLLFIATIGVLLTATAFVILVRTLVYGAE